MDLRIQRKRTDSGWARVCLFTSTLLWSCVLHFNEGHVVDLNLQDFLHFLFQPCSLSWDHLLFAPLIRSKTKICHLLWIYTTAIRSFGGVVQIAAQRCDSIVWHVYDSYNPKWKFINSLYSDWYSFPLSACSQPVCYGAQHCKYSWADWGDQWLYPWKLDPERARWLSDPAVRQLADNNNNNRGAAGDCQERFR